MIFFKKISLIGLGLKVGNTTNVVTIHKFQHCNFLFWAMGWGAFVQRVIRLGKWHVDTDHEAQTQRRQGQV
jgi:hypothetical protein